MSERDGGSVTSLGERLAPGSGGYGRVLRDKRFRRLWIGQFVSGIGDWLVIGFLMPLVTTLSGGSSFAVAGILIAKIIPALVFGSVIGALVDRFDRRRLMIACDLIRAVLTLGLIVTNSLWIIYLVVMLMETASMFFVPAKNALIPALVSEEDLATANGLSYTTQQASMLIGLTASGAILAVFEAVLRAAIHAKVPLLHLGLTLFPEVLGPKAGVLLDVLTFLFSAFMIWRIAIVACPACEKESRFDLSLIGRDVREAFVLLAERRELRGLLITIGVAIFGGGAIVPVGWTFVQQNLTGAVPFLAAGRLSAQQVGSARQTFMLVFLALGMALGAVFVPRLAERVSLRRLFVGGVVGFGASMLAFASVSIYAVAAVFASLAGGGIAVVSVSGYTYLAEQTADAIRGRVFTALESVIRVSLLLSMVVMAPLGDLVSRAVTGIAARAGAPLPEVYFTGSRITLWLSAAIVVGAAAYAVRTIDLHEHSRGGDATSEGREVTSDG